ncbi:hypothetical protein [Microcoleus sp. B13-B6]|uniref:hypothetical protein n=1 Tax=Microcoleus sp. B13-B6 TaxID=2818652 RepID=UPI002FD6A60E
MPVLDDCKQLQKTDSLWNGFWVSTGTGSPAHPTIKQTLCGTGILPVLDDCKQLQKTDSLWNRHLACS